MHMKKAVIFDLDGTLANTLTSLAYCTNRALEDFGLQAIPQECYKKFVGNGARMQITRALRYAGAKEQPSPVRDDDGFAAVPCLLDEVYDRYMEYFAKDCMYEVKPYPGIPELLDTLKEKNIKIAVFSNKPHANTVDVVETLFGKGFLMLCRDRKRMSPKSLRRTAYMRLWNGSTFRRRKRFMSATAGWISKQAEPQATSPLACCGDFGMRKSCGHIMRTR